MYGQHLGEFKPKYTHLDRSKTHFFTTRSPAHFQTVMKINNFMMG